MRNDNYVTLNVKPHKAVTSCPALFRKKMIFRIVDKRESISLVQIRYHEPFEWAGMQYVRDELRGVEIWLTNRNLKKW